MGFFCFPYDVCQDISISFKLILIYDIAVVNTFLVQFVFPVDRA